jgi:uncharacterized SAM-binding protein YcdF (DUF218 family)
MFTSLKLIEPFLLPPALIALGLLAVLVLLLARRFKAGGTILAAVLLFFYLLSTDLGMRPLVRSLMRLLPDPEAAFSDPEKPDGAEAVVVLAGGAYRRGSHRPRSELGGDSWKRLWHGLELYRRFGGKLPLLYAGGSGDPFDPVGIEPGLAKEYTLEMGVPEKDVWTEAASRNTFENTREIKQILDERFPGVGRHRIILVTSFIHMPRALLTMRKAGIEAIPAPADFPLGNPDKLFYFGFIPMIDRFGYSTACVREWIGILGYRLMGRL